MQTANDQQRFFGIQLDFFAGRGERRVEPLLERRARFEDRREEKVQQGPQFGQLVLQGRAGEQETMRSDVVRVENLR